MRKFFKLLAIMLVSVAVALLLSEGILRLLAGGAYGFRRTYAFDEYTGYDTKHGIDMAIDVRGEYRNVVHVNSKGLVGGEVPYEKLPGTFRVLVVGDSFTAGGTVPVDSLFTEVLERKFRNASSPGIEVLSKGVTSWSLEPEVVFVEREGVKYRPDVVVIAMFNPQDLWYDYHRSIFELENGTLRENSQAPKPFPVEDFKRVCSESELCGLLQLYYYRPSDLPASDELYWQIYRQYLVDGYKEQETALAIEEEKAVLRKFVNLSKTWNFTPVLLLIPFREQTNRTMLSELAARRNITLDSLNVTKTNREWASLSGNGLSVLDPLEYLSEHGAASLYWKIDAHLNPSGNEALAQYMYEELTRRRLVPVSSAP